MTRILFLHEVGYFEKPIFEMHEFPEHLANRGHEVGFLDFQEFDSGDAVGSIGQRRNGRVVPDTDFLYFSQTNRLSGLARRLLAVLTFPKFFRSVLKEFDPDVVVSFSVPTSGWQALYICRRLRIPLIFRALDVSHKIRSTKLSGFVKVTEKYIYRKSDWVSCNNPAMRDYCISLGASEAFSSVDLPPLDLSHFETWTGPKQALLSNLEIPEDSTVVLYMGSFFYFSGLDQVLRALSKLDPKPYLVLVGGGEQEAELRALARHLEIEDWVRFTGYVAFQDLPSHLAMADVAINPMAPSLVSDTALPNKVLQYMASGLPIVSTKLKGLSSLFGNLEGLQLVHQPSEVLSTAVQLAKDPNRLNLGEKNRQAVRQKFSIDKTLDQFESRIERMGQEL